VQEVSIDSDDLADRGAKKFIDLLKKIGPRSKDILNYSYPPLLYQREEGEADEEDEDEDEEVHDEGECDEETDPTHNSHMLDDSGDVMG
jgi:hypothetical protein